MVATAAIDAVAPPRFEGRVARRHAPLVSLVRFADGCAMDGDASSLPPLLDTLSLELDKERYWSSNYPTRPSLSKFSSVPAMGRYGSGYQ